MSEPDEREDVINLFSGKDRRQARRILGADVMAPAVLRAAYFFPRSNGEDLIAALCARGELEEEQGRDLRRASLRDNPESETIEVVPGGRVQRGRRFEGIVWGARDREGPLDPRRQRSAMAEQTITLSVGPQGSVREDSTLFRAGELEAGDRDLATRARLRVVEAYRQARASSPLFAPHADLVFEHVSQLGIGGMGVVHRVVDRRLGREAALKVIRYNRVSESEVRRFMREASITARLDHPNIPPVFEAGTDAAGQHYMLMQVIKGEPFNDKIKRYHRNRASSARVLRESIEVIVSVGEALAYAHDRGIVHRDIKPGNVMVGAFGEVMLMDWGLARDVNEREEGRGVDLASAEGLVEEPRGVELTQVGAIMGTVGYMAPEQARGEPVDARADVFSLGAMLSKLLTNQVPFDGQGTLDRLRATQQNRVVPPIERRPDISKELNEIAARALHPNPEFRTATAAEFIADLKAYLAGYEVSVYKYTAHERFLRWIRRNPLPLLIMIFTAATLAGSYMIYAAMSRASEQAEARRKEERLRLRAEAESKRAREAEVRAEARAREAEAAKSQAEAQRQKAVAAEKVATEKAAEASAARSRSEKLLIESEAAKKDAILARTTAEEERRKADRNLATYFTEKADRVIKEERDPLKAEAFLAKSIALQPRSWAARTLLLRTRLRSARLSWTSPHAMPIYALAARPAGRFEALAATGVEGAVYLWSPESGRELQRLTGHRGKVLAAAFHPEEPRLVSGGEDREVLVWDLTTGQPLARLDQGEDARVVSLAFGPGGEVAVAGTELIREPGAEPTRRSFVKLWSVKARSHRRLPADVGSIAALAFDPARRGRLVTSGDALAVWDLEKLTATTVRKDHGERIAALAFSGDGRRLATGSAGGRVILWDAGAVAPVSSFAVGAELRGLGLDGDGSELLTAGGDALVRRWSATGEALGQYQGHQRELSGAGYVGAGRVVSGDLGGGLRVWRPESGATDWRLTGHAGAVRAVAYGPDGLIASAGADGAVILWGGEGVELARFEDHGLAVNAVAFDASGGFLASGGDDEVVRLWSVKERRLVATLTGHAQAVTAVAFSPDGKLLASGSGREKSAAEKVWVWDVARREPIARLGFHDNAVTALAFDPSGGVLASASDDKTIRLWDVAGRRDLGALVGHGDKVTSLSFHPTRAWLASGGMDRTIRLWDVETQQPLQVLEGPEASINGVAFSPRGRFLASVGDDRLLRLWQSEAGRYSAAFVLSGHRREINGLAFSSDGQRIATGCEDNTVKVWAFRDLELRGHDEAITDLALSPDGATLLTGSNDRTLRFWDLASARSTAVIQGRARKVGRVAFSPDGRLAAWTNGTNTVRLYDLVEGKLLPALEGHEDMVLALAFRPDSKALASAGMDRTVRLWDVERQEAVGAPLTGHTEPVAALAFSGDGRRLISASWDRSMRLWRLSDGVTERRFDGHAAAVTAVDLAMQGGRLLAASGGDDDTVRLWDATSGRELARFESHRGAVTDLAFDASGELLASSSDDGTARLWAVAAERELLTLRGHAGRVTAVAFREGDGLELCSAGVDGSVRFWELDDAVECVEAVRIDDLRALEEEARLLLERSGARTGVEVRGLDLAPRPDNAMVKGG